MQKTMSTQGDNQDPGPETCHDRPCDNSPYLTDPSCALCMEPKRRSRCFPINYVEKVCAIVPQNYYVPSQFKMDGNTTYHADFTPKPYGKTNSFNPGSTYRKSSFAFRGLSEYKNAYTPYKVDPFVKPAWAKLAEFKPVEATFNGISTYKASFQPLCGEPAKILRPQVFQNLASGTLDHLTTYNMQFVPYNFQKLCLIKPEEHVVGTSIQPFHGITMYTSSYIPPCLEPKTKSYKPTRRFQALDYQFEDDTTYSGTYRPFAFQRCTPIQKRNCYIFKDLKL